MGDQGKINLPIQILQLGGGNRLTLDRDALKKILLAEHVKNLPVVVISIAGKFRTGKSFLLNFFLQYMRNKTKEDWMTDPNNPQGGFQWRNGSERETTGIWMWSEVFVVTTTEGKKVAVLFLDNQGTFDCKSTVHECTTIFAFSTMASSVQIYNLSRNICEDDLLHLQLFTQYGQLAMQGTTTKPFQKLLFLVRDWQYAYEKPFGLDGGKQLLKQCLMGAEKQELQSVRQDIWSCFMEMCCYLMPSPGTKVESTQSFVGELRDINNDFKDQLRVLVTSLLEPNNLIVKKNGTLDITCQDLLVYLERQVQVFNEDNLPVTQSMFKATAEANNLTAVSRALDHYRHSMEEVLREGQPFLERESLLEKHQRVQESALKVFDNVPKLGGLTYSETPKNDLKKVIKELYKTFYNSNEGARIVAQSQKIMEEARKDAQQLLEEAGAKYDKILEDARAASARVEAMCKAMGLITMTASAFMGFLPAMAGAAGTFARALPIAAAGVCNVARAIAGNAEVPLVGGYTAALPPPTTRGNREDGESDSHRDQDTSKRTQPSHK